MCKWHGGSYEGNLPVKLHSTAEGENKICSVDPCIQPLVQAINDAGIRTLNSCCGHGVRPTSIVLEDGRYLMILSQEDHDIISNRYPALCEASPRAEAVANAPYWSPGGAK